MNASAVLIRAPRTRGSTTRRSSAILSAALLSAFALLWLPALRSSLWLDEIGTFWVIKDGWADALHRGYEFHGQPVYYLVVWIARHLFGTGELGLRLPSLLAMGGAAYLVFRIGRRLWDWLTGVLAAVVFVASSDVAFAAADARPYAFLYLAAAAATLVLIRWLDEGRRRDAVFYVLLAGLTVHLQLLAFPVLIVHGLYAVWRTRRMPERRASLAVAAVGLAALLAPGIASLAWYASRRSSFSFAGSPRLDDLLWFVFPLLVAGGVALLQKRRAERSVETASEDEGRALLAGGLLLAPPLILFAVSSFSPTLRVFYPRYYEIAVIGVALVAGWTISQVRRIGAASLLALLLVGALIWDAGVTTDHFDTDWRAAAAFERSRAEQDTPVFVQAGFVESTDVDWLRDQERSSYLLAPLSYYRFVGDAVPLPFHLDAPSRTYLEQTTQRTLSRGRPFIVVVSARTDILTAWFADQTRSLGMTLTEYRRFGLVSVAHFQAEAPS